MTPPASADEGLPRVSYSMTGADIEPGVPHSGQPKSAQRKKSFVATIFGRSSSKSSARSSLAAIADEQ
jgi:hypothetical protein